MFYCGLAGQDIRGPAFDLNLFLLIGYFLCIVAGLFGLRVTGFFICFFLILLSLRFSFLPLISFLFFFFSLFFSLPSGPEELFLDTHVSVRAAPGWDNTVHVVGLNRKSRRRER